MKLSFATLALLASSVVAAPALTAAQAQATPGPRIDVERSIREGYLAIRAAEGNLVERSQTVSPVLAGPNAVPSSSATRTRSATAWGGAVIEYPPAGTFTAVSATIVLPTPTHVSSNPADTQGAMIWVGIDDNAILQTGIRLQATSAGSITYTAWYEWFPAGLTYVPTSILSFSPGDTVFLGVVSTSPTTGNVTIINVSTGAKFNTTLSGTRALTGTGVEWVAEDYKINGNLVPLVNWNSVTFTNCSASTSTGQTVHAWDNGTVWDMIQNNTHYSSTSGTQGTVVVQYIGPK